MTGEHTSARWGFVWVERLWLDIKYGCRMLGSSPGFTVIAVLSLAIGIGANCAIFSFADALLLRPLPVARPGEVFTVGSTSSLEALNASSLVSSYPDYVDIRDRSKSFAGLAAFDDVTVGFTIDPKAPPKLKTGNARQRQPLLVDGRGTDHWTRIQARRESGTGPRRRRRARPHHVGAGLRIGPRRARPHRTNQRDRFHGDWRRAARVQRHGPVRAL